MRTSRACFVALGAALAAGGAANAPAQPHGTAVRCRAGFADTVVRNRHVCRPAADIRAGIAASPDANRIGGTFTFDVTVANVGRRAAARAVLTADVGGELVSASTPTGPCETVAPRSTCQLGALARGARATA